MKKAELQKYRQVVGKLQWLVTARPDIAFRVKTLARETSGVTPDSWRKVKHLLRYLQGTKNIVFKIQPDVRLQSSEVDLDLHVFSDSDWAGDVATRKSASGFLVQLCGTTIVFGSRTQATIATSSCEAELCGLGTATAEALHIQHLLHEASFSKNLPSITVFADSSATKSLSSRIGVGHTSKHIQLRCLYTQALISSKLIKLQKAHTSLNFADLFTKQLPDKALTELRDKVGLQGCTVFRMG